ncbi:MAG: FAD-dependent oxidoreductase [Planctomycetia bacterium]|nr:FAD-dependent oxidoreductase [Planctomycetia bacterium]
MRTRIRLVVSLAWVAALLGARPVAGQAPGTLLVEAESFADHGGWTLDTQFITEMGSPYLLAHGLGRPVADATTTITVPAAGDYRVFVRTKDWVARWRAPGDAPGRFQVVIGGTALTTTFGTGPATWGWQDGGTVSLPAGAVPLALRDLTGFDGRCDCIALVPAGPTATAPPDDSGVLPAWRRTALGLPSEPEVKGPYDLVVVGGGYAGMGAALAAARMGLTVALVQNRPVLGGNGSSEVRVWAMGLIRRGKYPRIGEIVEEFADRATKSPGTAEEFEDAKKEALVRAEPSIDLFLDTHAFAATTEAGRITAVTCLDTHTSRELAITGAFFCDATGHATLGHLAGAETVMEEKGRMGMSNMWAWAEAATPQPFPATPWALPLSMEDFPYPRDFHGQWFWESGFDKDPLADAEGIRDWNLRAVYGAFNAMKNGDGAADHPRAILTWVAAIGGPRESRRILGDVVLGQDDIVAKREFPDGCVPSTWSIDLHYPKEEYARKFPDNPFISIAVHDRRVDRSYGYPIPYRCFYSKDLSNLFMAGRCISVTHEALGTVRVMKTCGMMGEVVGKAASVAIRHHTTPRGVYEKYWGEMEELLRLPGKARRTTADGPITIPADALPLAGPHGPPTGVDPAQLARDRGALVKDDLEAVRTGTWTAGTGLAGYVGNGYHYASPDSGATARYAFTVPAAGVYEVLVGWQPHENRGPAVPVVVETATGRSAVRLDMRRPAPLPGGFGSAGRVTLGADDGCEVVIGSEGARGIVHADAVLLVPVPR